MAGGRVISAVLTLKDKDFGTTAQKSASAMNELERKTRHSGNTIKNFGKSATSNFKSVAAGAASIVTAIGVTKALSSAFDTVKSSIGDAMDRIDTMEQFERVMGVMVNDTEAVNNTMERLDDILDGTSMRTDVMANSIQGFVTRGMEIDKATDTIEAWGNAVSFYGDGSSEQFDSVSDALQNMVANGKVDMQQMNRIHSAGIPAVEIYADAVGKSSSTVSEEMSKGAISAEDFVSVVSEAMMEGTEKFPEISNAMVEQGSTWQSVMANIGNYVSLGVRDVITSIDEMLVENGLPDMRGMLDSFGRKFGEVISGISEKIPIATEYLVGFYEQSKPGLDWLKDTAFPAIGEAADTVVDGVKGVYDFVTENWPLIAPVVAGVIATFTAFKAGITAITTAKTIWAAATSGVQLATAILNGTLAVTPFGWVVLAIGAVVAAGVALYMNWDTVNEKAGQLWEKTKEVFGNIYSWASEKIAGVTGFFSDLYNNFINFKNAITNFALPKWVSSIGGTIGKGASAVKNLVSGSHATGLDRVPYDGYVAELHKGEMVIPATQSENLRNQGVNIHNIDKSVPSAVISGAATNQYTYQTATTSNVDRSVSRSEERNTTNQYSYQTTNVSNSELPQLIQALMALVKVLSNTSQGDVILKIDGYNKSVNEIVNELVPALKLRLANM